MNVASAGSEVPYAAKSALPTFSTLAESTVSCRASSSAKTRAIGSMYSVEAGGKIGLDGQLDAQFSPKVGPAFSTHVKIPCLDQFAKASDGLTVLPVTVTMKGSAANPEFGTKVKTAGAAKRTGGELVGVMTNLLTGCQGGDAEENPALPLFDRKKE